MVQKKFSFSFHNFTINSSNHFSEEIRENLVSILFFEYIFEICKKCYTDHVELTKHDLHF